MIEESFSRLQPREENPAARRVRQMSRGLRPFIHDSGLQTKDIPGASYLDLGDSLRLAFMLTPQCPSDLHSDAEEILTRLTTALKSGVVPIQPTLLTVFLKNGDDRLECEQILKDRFGDNLPVTQFVLQPPCCGAHLAIEAWGIGGEGARVERHDQQALSVSYDGVRWVYCGGIELPAGNGVYHQANQALVQLDAALARAGACFEDVVRTWFYLGRITDLDTQKHQRYQEMNRARSDFYSKLQFCSKHSPPSRLHPMFPASTGIGMASDRLVVSCMAFQTDRKDVKLVPLENPGQIPAYTYHPKYSPKSPKFSRAMALLLGNYTTTWVSGTASIINSESVFLGDVERQTEQTLDNIEKLISCDNFIAHELPESGATLQDLAKVRIYVKNQADFKRCKAVCDRRLKGIPAIYALADVCRPELLVEIEGVAFSRSSAAADKGSST